MAKLGKLLLPARLRRRRRRRRSGAVVQPRLEGGRDGLVQLDDHKYSRGAR